MKSNNTVPVTVGFNSSLIIGSLLLTDWVLSVESPLDFDWEWSKEHITSVLESELGRELSEHIFDDGMTNGSSETGNLLVISRHWQKEFASIEWSEIERIVRDKINTRPS